ncbi:sensor histidine kinase [Dokdonia sinensis]|uniref:sensor histidine kinase n=1 Tax=Dokdonia sinensis TaxID=2479847 RepID=UPI001374A13C|nr:two-component regulator propeller domain-containing protein [Dokdonia sinensis]
MRYHITLIFLCCFYNSISQNRFAHFTTVDGLPNNLCYGLEQDDKGYIWVGTDDGLSKFDGNTFKNFRTGQGFHSNYVIAPILHKNNLVAGTWGRGLYQLDNQSFRRLVPRDSLSKVNNLVSAYGALWSTSISDNFLFRKNNNGVYEKTNFQLSFQNDSLRIVVNQKPVQVPIQFHKIKDKLYITGRNHPIKNTVNGVYEISQNLELTRAFNALKEFNISTLSYKDDIIYAGSGNTIMMVQGNRIIKKIVLKDFNDVLFKAIRYFDKILILSGKSTLPQKLVTYDLEGNKIQDVTAALNIKTNISDILLDHESNIWVSSYGQGVYCFFAPEKYAFKEYKGTRNKLIKDIEGLDDQVFLLSDNSLFIYKDHKLEMERSLKNSPNKISKIENKIRLSVFERDLNDQISIPKIEIGIESIAYETQQGVYRIKEDTLLFPNDTKLIKDRKLVALLMNDMVVFNDKLMIATNSGLLVESNNELLSYPKIDYQIHQFYKDDDQMFMATSNGLFVVDKNENITQIEGTEKLEINAVTIDFKGQIWLGTNNGIVIYKDEKLERLYLKNSLGSSYITSFYEDSGKEMWFGTNDGGYSIDNTMDIQYQEAPLIHINQSGNKFDLNIISYNRADALISQYQINDDPWISTKETVLDFNNLEQGDYNFQLRSKKIDGVWGYSDTFQFQLRDPWYMQPVFLIGSTAILSLFMILIISAKLKNTRKRNTILNEAITSKTTLEKELAQVRDRMAKDFHDEMGNKLARITMVSEHILSETDAALDSFTHKSLTTVKTDAEDLYRGTRDFMFSLQPDSDYLLEVVDYIIDFSRDYLSSWNIECEIEKDIPNNPRLPYYYNRQIILIFKEAITNVAKHSDATMVHLKFQYDHPLVKMQCIDNGKGYAFAKAKKTRGLSYMKERASKINFTFHIDTLPTGTTVVLQGSIA